MKHLPSLLIIAGAGTKSGKTTAACHILELLKGSGIVAIKLSPHFHETTPGLNLMKEGKGFAIYEETDPESGKDSSRMLRSGAARVFFAKVWDEMLINVFDYILDLVPAGTPVICESIALGSIIRPGILVIMYSKTVNKYKDIKHLEELPHVSLQFENLDDLTVLPFIFTDGAWKLKQKK